MEVLGDLEAISAVFRGTIFAVGDAHSRRLFRGLKRSVERRTYSSWGYRLVAREEEGGKTEDGLADHSDVTEQKLSAGVRSGTER